MNGKEDQGAIEEEEREGNQFASQLRDELERSGAEWTQDPAYEGSIGRTMFDGPSSKDNLVTAIVPSAEVMAIPAQSIVEIRSRTDGDGRLYRGIVVEGPFYEPNGLRADAPIVVTSAAHGAMFMPQYHAKLQIEIIGEQIDGTTVPPRFRPLPNSPVFVLDRKVTEEVLNVRGDLDLGLALGHDDMKVGIPTDKKNVLFRHTAVLGTTGGGKSNTVGGIVGSLQESNAAVVLFDTEGEYSALNDATEDENIKEALKIRGLLPQGVNGTQLLKLVGRDTTNPAHPEKVDFTLRFDQLSPYAVMEILEFNDAQQDRFLKAWEIARTLMLRLKIFPNSNDEYQEMLELDEFETGYPRLTLSMMYEVVRACACVIDKSLTDDKGNITFPLNSALKGNEKTLIQVVNAADLPKVKSSWFKVQGSLSKLLRLKIFDNPAARPFDFAKITRPGVVTIIDLSDTTSPRVNNLVIAELLRGLLDTQDRIYSEKSSDEPNRVVVVIEEAHEFLSSKRIKQMPVLFDQVARIARRGRKRWLGLLFVTQFPQHLPAEVLGLVNNYIIHQITDSGVVDRLRRTIGGVDDGLWRRVSNLAQGQALVSTTSLARPLLVAVHPARCKLLMVD